MFDEFEKPRDENEQKLREYTLRSKRLEYPPLADLGATVYQIEGWELMTLLLENAEYFKQDGGSWYGVCQGGITRSELCNLLFKDLSIPRAKDRTVGKRGEGFSIWNLVTKMSQATFEDGKLKFSDFDGGINRIIYFLSPELTDRESVLRFFTKSLEQSKPENAKDDKIIFFIVSDNERLFSFLYQQIQNLLKQGKTNQEVIEEINEKFNDDKKTKKLDVSNPAELFK